MIKKGLFLIMCICSLVSGCSCNGKSEIMKDYPSLDKKHVYEEIDVFELTSLIEKEDFYLIMGFPACPWCQAIMGVLNEVAHENNVKKIYYLDIKDIRDNEGTTGFNEFHALSSGIFKDAKDIEKDRINAPTFVKVEDGEMKAYHIDTVSSHVMNENMVLPPLTDEQIIELKSILKGVIEA